MRDVIEKRLFKRKMAKQFVAILIFGCINHFAFSQSAYPIEKGCFKVYKIDNSFPDFHLVFVKKGQENYTIYSERTLIVKGQRLKIGNDYYLELTRKIDTLVNGQVITPMNYLDIAYFGGKYSGTQIGKLCYAKNLRGLVIPNNSELTITKTDKSITGIFTQQMFNRFTIVEFKSNMTFDYHVMSERAHRKTSGRYDVKGDTIVLDSYSRCSDFDFNDEKWLELSSKRILISNNHNDKKENWSILEKNKRFDSIPNQRSDFALKIDSLKINELSWIKDTINYDSELKLIIREPLPPKEPIVIINGEPVKYNFMLNYYTLADIDSLTFMTGDTLINSGIHGGQAEYGIIIVNTKDKNRNANTQYSKKR